jgi:hypothetical protein
MCQIVLGYIHAFPALQQQKEDLGASENILYNTLKKLIL